MTDPAAIVCDHERGCITCGDEAMAMLVVRIDVARELALCEDEDGERSSVEIALVDPVVPGDNLLVHAGTALQKLERSPTFGCESPEAESRPRDAGLDARRR